MLKVCTIEIAVLLFMVILSIFELYFDKVNMLYLPSALGQYVMMVVLHVADLYTQNKRNVCFSGKFSYCTVLQESELVHLPDKCCPECSSVKPSCVYEGKSYKVLFYYTSRFNET